MLASHIVFGAYGFWLPNDPRGSWSEFVWSINLRKFGPPKKPDSARSQARIEHDHGKRRAAKAALAYPEVQFSDEQVAVVAGGFQQAIEEAGYVVFACAIMPGHVHLVVRAHRRTPSKIAGHLKSRATQHLHKSTVWGDLARPVWGEKCWKVYLDEPDDVAEAVDYVDQNPLRDGLPAQHWPFIVPWC
jgi:REP element-mobilizing transposase RayT